MLQQPTIEELAIADAMGIPLHVMGSRGGSVFSEAVNSDVLESNALFTHELPVFLKTSQFVIQALKLEVFGKCMFWFNWEERLFWFNALTTPAARMFFGEEPWEVMRNAILALPSVQEYILKQQKRAEYQEGL